MPSKIIPPNKLPDGELDTRKGYAHALGSMSKVAMATSVAAVCVSLAMMFMMPLKREVPYVVQVNKTTGEVTVPPNQVAEAFNPTWANEAFFLRRWLVDLFTINRYLTVQVYDPRAQAFLRGQNAIAEYQSFRAEDQTFERLVKDPTLIRNVSVDDLTPVAGTRNGAVASVTLTTISGGQTTTQKLLVTLYFALISSTDRAEIDQDPIGIYITDFKISSK
jgi:type IV secretory pathway component VirB8